MNRKIFTSTLIILAISACTPSLADTTPLPPPATITPTLSFNTPVPIINTPGAGDGTVVTPFATFGAGDGTFAVILVPEEDVLNIRSGPGVENAVVGTLRPAQSGLTRTGRSSSAGDDLWVEIRNPSGGTGWVNAKFLTEYIAPSAFCGDARIVSLLRNLEAAVHAKDGESFKSLVSPAHGLDVVYIRDGMVANYSQEESGWAFQSTYEVDWGPGAGSGEPVKGTFPEIILPALQDGFENATFTCNEIKLGGATYETEWPAEYTNINFYAIHNPGNDPSYGGLDWRTWLAGVEYVGGEPYLFALLNYQWEP